MRKADGLRPIEIGDRARDAQDAVIAAGGEGHAVKRLVHELLALGRERAELRERTRAHVGVRRGGVVPVAGALHGAGRVFTGVYPALATDAAPLLAAAMLAADSASSIEDVVFERRFGCAEGFAAFGAAVQVQGRTLDIRPVRQLQGACARAADLRGGAALVVAALAARGRSRITDTGYIDRGYAGFAQMLAELGAQIEREMPRESASEKKTPSKKQN